MRIVHHKKETLMTEGSIPGHLIRFAIPMMVGFIFQQLYSAVDSVIVGHFVSMQALAAVGTTGSIINTLIGAFMGLATGAGVVISQHYGAQEDDRVHETVHTAMLLALLFGLAFTVIGTAGAPMMLRFMRTPDDVFPEAVTYLRIYFMGSTGLLVYNLGSGILRAVGDSQRPLYFLIISAVTNTLLDLALVIFFHMGVAGVALATLLSQLLSAILVCAALMRTRECFRLEPGKLRIYGSSLRHIIHIGLPTSLQQMLVSFSNVFVQSYINSFQTACMAGWSVYARIDGFTGIPLNSLSMALTTFVGQNIGAGNRARARRGATIALALGYTATLCMALVQEVLAEKLVSLFGADAEAMVYGTMFLRWIAPLNLLLVASSLLAAALRGCGETRVTTFFQIMSFIVIRQIYLAIISRVTESALLIGLGYPLGWFFASLSTIIYYYFSGWEKHLIKVTDAAE